MTTLFTEEKRCAVCGKTSEHRGVASTNAFGSMDLDTRPPEMKRSTMSLWIQTCPSCGFCAPEISESIDGSKEMAGTDLYQQQLNNPDYPKLANAFLCFSLIQENAGVYNESGWAAIHAAWSCDDSGTDESARYCRKRAVEVLKKARGNGQHFGQMVGAEETLLVDLLRRSGQFEEAFMMCDKGLEKHPEQIIEKILKFQQKLIQLKDVACYRVEEIK